MQGAEALELPIIHLPCDHGVNTHTGHDMPKARTLQVLERKGFTLLYLRHEVPLTAAGHGPIILDLILYYTRLL